MDNQTTTDDDAQTLPDAPEYELPYEPDSYAIDAAKGSGYYGVMHAAEYEWNNQTCTVEAYGEYDPDARPGDRHRTIDGKPRRSLKFHTTWMDIAEAKPCLREIGSYNRFDGDVTADAIDDLRNPRRSSLAASRRPSCTCGRSTRRPRTTCSTTSLLKTNPSATIRTRSSRRRTTGRTNSAA